jgi:hypothetical protein
VDPAPNGGIIMAWNKSGGRSNVVKANEESDLEGEVRDFVRRDAAMLRRHPETDDSGVLTANIGTLLQRVAGSSIQEIEVIIVELQTLRLRLTTETTRVQREIVDYATLSQAAVQSTKIIAESILTLKNASERDALRVG